jgi:hypothetical protein
MVMSRNPPGTRMSAASGPSLAGNLPIAQLQSL